MDDRFAGIPSWYSNQPLRLVILPLLGTYSIGNGYGHHYVETASSVEQYGQLLVY